MRTSALATLTMACPTCARDMEVEIVADDGIIRDGRVVVKLSCRYDHECEI